MSVTGRLPRRTQHPALAAAGAVLALALLPAAAAGQRLDIAVKPAAITFPPADPDTAPVVAAASVEITYRVQQWNGPWSITLLAAGDLISGGASVDISNVSWIATPSPPFQNGTLSKTVAQRLASGTGQVPNRRGQITFRLANSWSYAAGVYTQTVIFTLSAP
jgi:hypothetical protein